MVKRIEIPNDYPVRIRLIRDDMTQAQLAKRLGVSPITLCRWENNQHKPTNLAWQQLLKLEKERKTKPSTITEGEIRLWKKTHLIKA